MKRILVADDNAISRELIREVFETELCEVVEACDGREALAKIEAARPDLILMDIQMPHFDGYAVLGRLRGDARYANLRVIAVTAYAMQGDRERALSAGFDGYVTKPVQVAALRALVEPLLASR